MVPGFFEGMNKPQVCAVRHAPARAREQRFSMPNLTAVTNGNLSPKHMNPAPNLPRLTGAPIASAMPKGVR